MGTEKHSKASRKRQLSIPKKKRIKMMKALARIRWAKVSKKDRKAHSIMMTNAKNITAK